jgi:penicillin-binding protein 1A
MNSVFKLLGILFLSIFLFFSIILVAGFIYLKVSLPSISKLKNYRPEQTNLVYDIHGNLVGFIGPVRRVFVPIDKIPPHVIQAFLAAEDANFYKHKGIDFWSLLRALYKNIVHGKVVQGGSTITQQVVKSLVLSPERTLRRKIKEMFLAWQIEKYLTKDQILTIYLNHIYLGGGAYGVEAAALTYFNKHVWELDLNEAAVLAGLPAAPSKYNPLQNYNLSIARRNYVLKRMAEVGFISPEKAQAISSQPIHLNPKNVNIPVYAAYFLDVIKEELKKLFPSEVVERGGLVVYTTLDLEWEKKAYENLMNTLSRMFTNREPPEIAVVCMENKNGGVRVLIGGRNYLASPYNRAILAKRQPGSAFKPFIWAKAIEDGVVSPEDVIPDEPITLPGGDQGKDWSPRNYDGQYLGPISLRDALAKSRNVVAVRLALMLGKERIYDMVQKLELNIPRDFNYSIALGSYELTPIELTRSFTIFPNLGRMVKPKFIEEVRDSLFAKTPIYKTDVVAKPVISPYTASIMNDFLQAVVLYGTGTCARGLGVPVAGKTGTTQEYRDAWFVGFTPTYTCGVWVGYDSGKTLERGETGGRVACPVWLSVMKGTNHKPQGFFLYTENTETQNQENTENLENQ